MLIIASYSFAADQYLLDTFGGRNYTIIGGATGDYNCLAYVLGCTDEFIWPWGAADPGLPTVDNYFNLKFYDRSYSNTSSNKIIAYYNTNNSQIGHFAKITQNGSNWDAGKTEAKLGARELVETNSHECYKENYGTIATKYK